MKNKIKFCHFEDCASPEERKLSPKLVFIEQITSLPFIVLYIFVAIAFFNGFRSDEDIAISAKSQQVVAQQVVVNPFNSSESGVSFKPHSMVIGKTQLGLPPAIQLSNEKIQLESKVFNITEITQEQIELPNSASYTIQTKEGQVFPIRIFENKMLVVGLGEMALLYNIEM
ncbi:MULTISPECIES: hypothetical protein [Vibrio]|uniref:Type II secretion system protein GspC N-terminal domain-containing protein n=2 Tax=Vibrio TaxID=662 RepID=A0AAX0M3H3_VIBPH|nr:MULTISPECIES: hypothetical protein [Vibrio]EJG0767725.1 hypothetical protein [Vibrio parahaemolyticus O5:K30]MCS0328430.1 hypothetical protein [Vibrio diabolicus]TVN09729.1 hypothetical protein FPV63_02105 [Vibrio cholerae]AXX63453.1 hypothetical protein FORC53_5114 [Vibrio vulnificus]EGQ8302368.1 hypothetical protein [Vibrio parahaemolyticus]